MQYLENSLHCFLVTFLCITNLSLHISAKDCLLIRHLAGKCNQITDKQLHYADLPSKPVFLNLFAAGVPSANVCVAHGTLCHCYGPSIYPTLCNKPVKQWYC